MYYIYFCVPIQNHGLVFSTLWTMNVLLQVDQCFHNLQDVQLAFSSDIIIRREASLVANLIKVQH